MPTLEPEDLEKIDEAVQEILRLLTEYEAALSKLTTPDRRMPDLPTSYPKK